MTSQEAMKYTCKPGYWLWNVAKVDETPNWQEQVKPYESLDTLFGYDRAMFMAKQYK